MQVSSIDREVRSTISFNNGESHHGVSQHIFAHMPFLKDVTPETSSSAVSCDQQRSCPM
jgi:hypothetical protein